MKTRLTVAASTLALATAMSATQGWAQSPTQSSEQQEQSTTTVREIIVTAQQREQNLQDVPIVVTAIGAQQLQDAGVRDIKDLTVVTPGLNVTSSTSNATTVARIRGVGTIGDNPGLESSVGVVVDGVYRARTGVAFGDLGELERVEVLKGPQGTLFGKNTSAGVINVISQRPEFEFGFNGEATVGNYDARGGSASVTGPILGDQLAGRLFFAARKRDGFYDVSTGEGPRERTDDQDENYLTTRGQILWTPNERFDALLIADYSHRYESCCVNVPTVVGPTARFIDLLATDAGTAQQADPFSRNTFANRSTDQKIKDSGVSVQLNYELTDDISVTSITAARKWETRNGQESDFSSADIWYRTPEIFDSEFDTFSQEIRLAGATENLDYLFGVFYSDERLDTKQGITFGADYESYFGYLLSATSPAPNPRTVSAITGLPFGSNFPVGGGARDTHEQSTESLAFFTNNSFRPAEDLEVTLGLRFTSEDKEVLSRYRNASPGNACRSAVARAAVLPAAAVSAICAPSADFAFDDVDNRQTRKENEMTGTLKLSYRFSEQLLTYGSYARGYKSGGFNLDRARFGPGRFNGDTSFGAETVDSYEVGAKTNLLDDSLLLNATIFHQTFENFQLNTYTGISFLVASIPEVVSRGLDADFVWETPIEGLSASGGVTYAETQYGDFVPPAGISARLPNSRISYAPLYSASTSLSYERELGADLKLRGTVSAKYTSAYNTGSNLDPLKIQDALTLVNARIGVGDADDRYTVELWAQNLTDEDYYQVVVDQPLQAGTYAGFLGAPRTFGVTVRTSF